MKSFGMFRIMRLVRSEVRSKRRRGLTVRRTCTVDAGRARRGPRSRRPRLCGGRTATLASAGYGAAAEATPAVAVGGAGSTSWYGNDVGRDVVGEMGGLGAATASTERGDGWLVAAASFASAAAFTPQDAAVAAGAGPTARRIPAEPLRWQRDRALGAGREGVIMGIAPCGTTPPWNGPCIPGTQGACGTLQQGGGGGGARGGHGRNSGGGGGVMQMYVVKPGTGGGGIHGAPLCGM